MLVLAPKVSNLESEPLVEPLLLLLLLLQDILNPKLLTLALVQLYLSSAKVAQQPTSEERTHSIGAVVVADVSYSAFDAGCLSFVQMVLLLQGLRHHFVAPQHLLLHIFELPDQVKLIGSLRLAVVFIAKEGKHLCEKSNQIYSNL